MDQDNTSGERDGALARLREAARNNSDATVLWHGAVADRVGLHPTDHKALSALQRRGPLTAGALADLTGLTTGSVTALVDRLARRDLVRRRRDPSDRRRVLVEVTEQAVEAIAPLVTAPARTAERLYDAYTTSEIAVIADFLDRNADRLRQATRALTARAADDGDQVK